MLVSGGLQPWNDELDPTLTLPASEPYTITLDGSPSKKTDTESIEWVGPVWHVTVGPVGVGPGDKDVLFVDPNTHSLTYHTNRPQSPVIDTSVSGRRAQYDFVVSGIADKSGASLNLHIPTEGGDLDITNAGSPVPSYIAFHLTRYSITGVDGFSHNAIALGPADIADLQFSNWTNPEQGIPLVVTDAGHSTTQTLTNQ